MVNRIWTAVAVALVALTVGGVVTSAAAGTTATMDVDLVVLADEGVGQFIDYNHDGLKLGDRVVVRSPLRTLGGAQVGRAMAECVVVSNKLTQTAGLWRCSYLLDLAEGDILVEGLDPRGDGSYTMAVAGGTGTYRLVAGDADFVDDADGTTMHLHLEV